MGPCNLPEHTYRDMLYQIRAAHPDIEYIYLTGDNPAHDLAYQTGARNMETITTSASIVKEVFPDKKIFPSLGNHDSFPCNSFPTGDDIDVEHLKGDWIYGNLTAVYGEWLDAEAMETFAKYGYYTMLAADQFRIVAVNSNFCLGYNFWMNHNYVDPFGQLEWLVATLEKAEIAQEQVHLLSHVPPNSECLGAWGREYGRILDRFRNTLVNHFYGHTHRDEFFIVYDAEFKYDPVSVGFIAPSVTTWKYLNPSYRIYTIDGPYTQLNRFAFYPYGSMRVIDAQTYVMNVTKANEAGNATQPEYELLYDARVDLGMASLFPKDYERLVDRLFYDDELWAKFELYYNNANWETTSDRERVICGLVTWNQIDGTKCFNYYPQLK